MRMNTKEYKIQDISQEDTEKVISHLKKFFFRDEPLNVNVQLLGPESNGECVELEKYCLEAIPEGLSVMAVDDNGNVVGVCLNGSHEPGHLEEMMTSAFECPNPRFRKILTLLANVERNADIFSKFPDVKRLLEVRILSVDMTWRGRGIATTLLKHTSEIARKHGFPLVRVDCTSYYSAKAVERLGFESIYTIQYKDYKAGGSEPVFDPIVPHTAVSTYVLRI